MKKPLLTLLLVIISPLLISCVHSETTKVTSNLPSIEEQLESDMFIKDQIIYKSGIDWVNDLTLTQDELVGEIQHQSSVPSEFINYTATELPIGTKIYSAKERNDILIVQTTKGINYYYKLSEG